MKSNKQILCAGLLAFALTGSIYAGDIQIPSAPTRSPGVPPSTEQESVKDNPLMKMEASIIAKVLQNASIFVLRLL